MRIAPRPEPHAKSDADITVATRASANTHLALVRHGRPSAPTADALRDPPLDEEGRAQAETVGERLALENIGAIVSSPLRRAVQTAEPLARRLSLPIQTIEGLAEIDALTGKYETIEALRARDDGSWEAFLADPVGYFGGDEATFRARILACFSQLLAQAGARRVAVFTHGIPINAMISHVLGYHGLTRIAPHYGSITRLAGPSIDALQVVSINETGHFTPAELGR